MKIVTVHGTFAGSDKQRGDRWWQRGSEFAAAVASALSIDQKDIVPMSWGSGENSEIARREGGKKVFNKINELINITKGEEKIIIISHSHGSNVVLEVFREAVRRKIDLNQVVKWISIGAPFVNRKEKFSQYYYLGFYTIPVILLIIMMSWISFYEYFISDNSNENIYVLSGMAFLFSVLILFTNRSRIRKREESARHLKAYVGKDKFFIINHPGDEAIFALKNANNYHYDSRKRKNYIDPIAFIFFIISIFTIILIFRNFNYDYESCVFGNRDIFFRPVCIAIYKLFPNDFVGYLYYVKKASEVIFALVCVLSFWFLSFFIAHFFAKPVDWVIGNLLRTRLVRAIWGWDVADSAVDSVSEVPNLELHYTIVKVPESLSSEIERNCNRELVRAGTDIRRTMAEVAYGKLSVNDALSNLGRSDLSMLIHNCYFTNKKMQKLIIDTIKSSA